MNKRARFSCSESWNQSLIFQGRLFRLCGGKLHKQWKTCHAVLRDDSSFRWYKDEGNLERRGEIWLEEVAEGIRFGQQALYRYGMPGPPTPSQKQHKKSPADMPLHIAIPAGQHPNKQSRDNVLWFAATDSLDYHQWIQALARSLGKQLVPTDVTNQSAVASWDTYWLILAPATDKQCSSVIARRAGLRSTGRTASLDNEANNDNSSDDNDNDRKSAAQSSKITHEQNMKTLCKLEIQPM